METNLRTACVVLVGSGLWLVGCAGSADETSQDSVAEGLVADSCETHSPAPDDPTGHTWTHCFNSNRVYEGNPCSVEGAPFTNMQTWTETAQCDTQSCGAKDSKPYYTVSNYVDYWYEICCNGHWKPNGGSRVMHSGEQVCKPVQFVCGDYYLETLQVVSVPATTTDNPSLTYSQLGCGPAPSPH
jgi:hypothetical protein